jgi:hypothetical protein
MLSNRYILGFPFIAAVISRERLERQLIADLSIFYVPYQSHSHHLVDGSSFQRPFRDIVCCCVSVFCQTRALT